MKTSKPTSWKIFACVCWSDIAVGVGTPKILKGPQSVGSPGKLPRGAKLGVRNPSLFLCRGGIVVEWLGMISFDLPLHVAASILSLSVYKRSVIVCVIRSAHNASGLGWKKYSVLDIMGVFEMLKKTGYRDKVMVWRSTCFIALWFRGPLQMIPTFTSAKKWNQREKHDVLAEFFGACQGAQIQHDILHITDGLLNSWPFGPFALRKWSLRCEKHRGLIVSAWSKLFCASCLLDLIRGCIGNHRLLQHPSHPFTSIRRGP